MPSVKTRLAFQQAKLEAARLALVDATNAVIEAAAALTQNQSNEPEEEPE